MKKTQDRTKEEQGIRQGMVLVLKNMKFHGRESQVSHKGKWNDGVTTSQ